MFLINGHLSPFFFFLAIVNTVMKILVPKAYWTSNDFLPLILRNGISWAKGVHTLHQRFCQQPAPTERVSTYLLASTGLCSLFHLWYSVGLEILSCFYFNCLLLTELNMFSYGYCSFVSICSFLVQLLSLFVLLLVYLRFEI